MSSLRTVEPIKRSEWKTTGASAEQSARYRDLQAELPELQRLADWMDSVFQIPGTNVKFGLDAILGLFPGIGDTLTSMVSLYILHAAHRRGVSRLAMTRMAANLAVDYCVGAVPFVGDAFDVYWKANQKNVELLRRHTLANPVSERRRRVGDWLFFAGLAAMVIVFLVGSITIAWTGIAWLATHAFGAG